MIVKKKIKKALLVLVCNLGIGIGSLRAEDPKPATPAPAGKVDVVQVKIDTENPPVMEEKKTDPAAWKPVEAPKDAKPVVAVLMNKGAGKENLTIKMVSVCDQNNVWCVANDGSKDAVYLLTSKGLEQKFDGVFVAAGKGVVAAINDKQEVFELEGGQGTTWKKIEGLKLHKISRPTPDVGWGLLEEAKGSYACFMFDDDEDKWVRVKSAMGQDVKGLIDLSANAEDIAFALTDKGEVLKRDIGRAQLFGKVKAVMEKNKGKKKNQKGKKAGKGKAKDRAPMKANAKKPGKKEKAAGKAGGKANKKQKVDAKK